MKKNFYQQPKKSKRGTFLLLSWSVFFLVAILATLQFVAPQSMQSMLQRFAYPLWSSESRISTSIGGFLMSLQGNRRLAEENKTLRRTLEETATLSLQNRMLTDENRELHGLLGRKRFASLVLAPVLRTPPGTFYDTMLIDVGKDTGVVSGNRVVVNGGVVIGTVSEINGRVGTVVLFSTHDSETEVLIGTSTARVVAKGRGSGNFIAEVPREINVQKGDIITLSGSPTLFFAEVEAVESNPADPFQSIFFQNPVNVNTLSFVQVVTDNEEIPEQLVPVAEIDELEQSSTETATSSIDQSEEL